MRGRSQRVSTKDGIDSTIQSERRKTALLLEVLSKGSSINLKNSGSGMARICPKDSFIRVKGIDLGDIEKIETGHIVVFDTVRMLMGARVISRNEGSLVLKSDCGRGLPFEVENSKIIGLVTHIQINKDYYPIYKSDKQMELHRKISKISENFVPITSFGKLNVFSVLLRKLRKRKINHINSQIIKYSLE